MMIMVVGFVLWLVFHGSKNGCVISQRFSYTIPIGIKKGWIKGVGSLRPILNKGRIKFNQGQIECWYLG